MQPLTIMGLFKRYTTAVVGTLLLLLVENVLLVLYPFLIGKTINDLLVGQYSYLWVLVGAFATHFVVGVSRRLYDTRVYSRIYSEVVSEFVQSQRIAGKSQSQIVARVELLRELVDFFEHDLPAALMGVSTLLGSIVMLGVLDPRISALCLGAFLVLGVLYTISKDAFQSANCNLNDAYEHQVDVIHRARPYRLGRFFNVFRNRAVRLSDLDAGMSAALEFVLIGVFVASLLLAATGGEASPGHIVATMTYVFEFYEALMLAPQLLQQRIRLSDISRRTVAQ